MGESTVGVMINDLKLFNKALQKLGRKNDLTFNMDGDIKKNGYFSIDIKPTGRHMMVGILTNMDEIKDDLPKGTRKLKNAKSVLYVSFGKDAEAQNLIIDLLKCHDKAGYIRLNDCGHGKFIEVDNKGLVLPNLNKKQLPQIKALRRYYNDLPIKLETVSLQKVFEFDVDDIIKVYVDKNPEVTKREAGNSATSSVYYSDMVVLVKGHLLPYLVDENDLYQIVNNNHINTTVLAERFIKSTPRNKIVYTQGKQRCDVFPA